VRQRPRPVESHLSITRRATATAALLWSPLHALLTSTAAPVRDARAARRSPSCPTCRHGYRGPARPRRSAARSDDHLHGLGLELRAELPPLLAHEQILSIESPCRRSLAHSGYRQTTSCGLTKCGAGLLSHRAPTGGERRVTRRSPPRTQQGFSGRTFLFEAKAVPGGALHSHARWLPAFAKLVGPAGAIRRLTNSLRSRPPDRR
jgi:hypothetical protein